MISIELIRREPDFIREACRKRGEDVPVDTILELDVRRRSAIAEGDALRARRNEVSRKLGQAQERPPELIDEMREMGTEIRALEETVRVTADQINALLVTIPNIPRDDVPIGEDDSGNLVARTVGEMPAYSFEPLPHWELAERLDIIDFQRGVKVAGSRFFVLKGKGSKLQRSLISWMLDLHTSDHGYEERYLPYLVNSASATGSGHLPKYAETMYHDDEDDLWLVPTAEVPADKSLPRRDSALWDGADSLRGAHSLFQAGEGGRG